MKYEEVMAAQYGGNHYKDRKIQPWEIWAAYEMDGWEASATKYLLRYKYKGQALEDLYKLKHNVEYLIAREERKLNVQTQSSQRKHPEGFEGDVLQLRPSTVSTAETCSETSISQKWRALNDYDDAPLGI
jgi:hypothetical protein